MSVYVTLEEIRAAGRSLPPLVRRTPLLPCAIEPAEAGRERLFLKPENLQVTGAYKVRAAFAVMASLTPRQRERGVALTSSGNFAQAFAFAGRYYGVQTAVVMLAVTSSCKIDATRALGAEVHLFDGSPLDRQKQVEALAFGRGMLAIDTWEEHAILAGHGTLGLEILQDMAEVEQVLVPVSSGGMAAGVAAALKLAAPHVRVVGVQPARANAAYRSLAAGYPVAIEDWNTIADGLSARRPGKAPFRHLQRYLDGIVLVEERDIGRAHMMLRQRAKIMAEPAGAVATAAFIGGKVDTGRRTVAVVSGGNLTEATMWALERLAQ